MVLIGSHGDKFYIILQGTVGVLIPSPIVKDSVKLIEEKRERIEERKALLKEVIAKIELEKKR